MLYRSAPATTRPSATGPARRRPRHLGAGDAFHGALLAGVIAWPDDLGRAVRLAADTATERVAHQGGRSWMSHVAPLIDVIDREALSPTFRPPSSWIHAETWTTTGRHPRNRCTTRPVRERSWTPHSGTESPTNHFEPFGHHVGYFAMGCFWGPEKLFWQLDGVTSTAVGYLEEGSTPNPAYEEVCSGQTGHAEAVRVVFDPEVISYPELLQGLLRKPRPHPRHAPRQ